MVVNSQQIYKVGPCVYSSTFTVNSTGFKELPVFKLCLYRALYGV